MEKIGAIILIGGQGERLKSDRPKQFLMLGDKPIYRHALDTIERSGLFHEIILVCHPEWTDLIAEESIPGGKTRQESSYKGLLGFKKRPDLVLIHDGVRPFVSEKILKENIDRAIQFGAVNTCIPTADTLVYAPKGILSSIPKRIDYLRGQTPQTFRMEWILNAHKKAVEEGIENATDDCQLVLRLGYPVHIVNGEERNIKITTELDLIIAEQIYTSV